MKEYDFLLIEPWYRSISHYNYDQKNLADILCQAGYRVVVVNFVKNNVFHNNQNYDCINLHFKDLFPDENYLNKNNTGKISMFIRRIVQEFRRYRHFKKILSSLDFSYKYIYLGTYLECTFPLLMNYHNNKRLFLWLHRSHLLLNCKLKININPYTSIKYLWMQKKIYKDKNINLIVSNGLIKDELLAGGVDSSRLIIRPERTIEDLPDFEYEKLNKKFTLLTVGFIRESKNIEFSLNSLKEMDLNFIIAGKSNARYNEILNKNIRKIKKADITRISGYIPEDDYHNLFLRSHFVLIADKIQGSTASSGVMLEALLKGRPIITPDRKPFNYYIDNFSIGIKYQPENEKSLSLAVNKAMKIGCKKFKNNLERFQKNYLIEEVAKSVKHQLDKTGIK